MKSVAPATDPSPSKPAPGSADDWESQYLAGATTTPAPCRGGCGPGGHFLAIHYTDPDDPVGPPWGVTRDELGRRFAPDFELLGEWVPRSYPNRVGRELMLWWRRRSRAAPTPDRAGNLGLRTAEAAGTAA